MEVFTCGKMVLSAARRKTVGGAGLISKQRSAGRYSTRA
jgi:hypothetical protein